MYAARFRIIAGSLGLLLGGILGTFIGAISPVIASLVYVVGGGVTTTLIVYYLPSKTLREVVMLG